MMGPGGGRNRMARSAIEAADRVIAVCAGDPVGLKNFIWAFDDVAELADRESIDIVLNRGRRGDFSEATALLERHCRIRPKALVPDCAPQVRAAVWDGCALKEVDAHNPFAGALGAVAAGIGAAEVTPRGLLVRLGGRP
jgi:hypothetical protein